MNASSCRKNGQNTKDKPIAGQVLFILKTPLDNVFWHTPDRSRG
jgi:hypothetical protein